MRISYAEALENIENDPNYCEQVESTIRWKKERIKSHEQGENDGENDEGDGHYSY